MLSNTSLTLSTNLTPEEMQKCIELANYEIILTMVRDNGDVFYILPHLKRADQIPPNSIAFLPSEIMYLIRMQDKEKVNRIFEMKKMFGGRIVYYGQEIKIKDSPADFLQSFGDAKKGQNGLQKFRRKRN